MVLGLMGDSTIVVAIDGLGLRSRRSECRHGFVYVDVDRPGLVYAESAPVRPIRSAELATSRHRTPAYQRATRRDQAAPAYQRATRRDRYAAVVYVLYAYRYRTVASRLLKTAMHESNFQELHAKSMTMTMTTTMHF